MLQLSNQEFFDLSNHMAAKSHKNMHLRKVKQVNGERCLNYINLMFRKSLRHLLGHACGPAVDIEYEIILENAVPVTRIIRKVGSHAAAIELLDKLKSQILNRMKTDTGDQPFTNYSEGEYYARRSREGKVTEALHEAVSQKIFSHEFAKNLVAWNFMMVKGRPKAQKLQEAETIADDSFDQLL